MSSNSTNWKNKKSRLRHLHYLVYLIPVALIIVGYFAISFATNEASPFTIVTGVSMQPTILAGSIAMISRVPFDQLKVGDIIVFTPPLASSSGGCDSSPGPSLTQESSGAPCFVIHRIVDILDTGGQIQIKTKGDNNPGSIPGIDFWITQQLYVGMVILQLPVAGYITQAPYNEYLGILLLALFIGELLWERRAPSQQISIPAAHSAPT